MEWVWGMISCTQWQLQPTQRSSDAPVAALPPCMRELSLNPHGRAVPRRSCCLLNARAGTDQGAQLWNAAVSKNCTSHQAGSQGKCIASAFSGVPHRIHWGASPIPFPWKVCCSLGWGESFCSRSFSKALPPSPRLVTTIGVFYSSFLQSSWSAAKQIAMTQIITTTEWELTLTS